MVAFSKEMFDTICGDKTCDTMVHPWTKGCLKAALMIYASSIVGSAKFYSLVYLVSVFFISQTIISFTEYRLYTLGLIRSLLINVVNNLFLYLKEGTSETIFFFSIICTIQVVTVYLRN